MDNRVNLNKNSDNTNNTSTNQQPVNVLAIVIILAIFAIGIGTPIFLHNHKLNLNLQYGIKVFDMDDVKLYRIDSYNDYYTCVNDSDTEAIIKIADIVYTVGSKETQELKISAPYGNFTIIVNNKYRLVETLDSRELRNKVK